MKTKEQIMAAEARDLKRFKKMRDTPKFKGYFPLMIAIISIVYMLDAMASDLHGGLSELEINYFANQLGLPYDSILSVFSLAGAATLLINLLSPFYKALADKLGRKIMFVISTGGMGLGLLLGFFSNNLILYFIGRTILTFFIIADIQVIYIMEVAPPEKRASLTALTKFFSILGILIIPLCRDLFLNESGSNWQIICLIPAIVAIVTVILIQLFVRESDVFLNERIRQLEQPFEERHPINEGKKKTKGQRKSGVFPGIAYVFRNKQTRSIAIANCIFMVGMSAFVYYFNTICMKGGMSTAQITQALYIFPIAAALVTLLAGFISDKLGRKMLCVIYAVAALVGLVVYITTVGSISPFITGLFYGICYGCYWAMGDSMGMMLAESSRTDIRSSAMAGLGLIAMAITMLSMAIFGVLVLSVNIAVLCITAGVITMAAVLLVIVLNVKETKGVDMTTIS